MSSANVELLTYLLDQAFDAGESHSLLSNLRDVRPEDWRWRPPGGHRSIARILEHAAVAQHLYAEHLFGGATLTYPDVLALSPLAADPDASGALIAWAREGHARFIEGMRTLTDADLLGERRTHYGKLTETRAIINALIQHDLYHAGEINHVRALRHGDDRWWPEFEPQRGD